MLVIVNEREEGVMVLALIGLGLELVPNAYPVPARQLADGLSTPKSGPVSL